jgi:DNA-directed RNA polymerase specialized sigma24 family protein
VAGVADTAPSTSRAELLHRLELALAALPPAERMAVVSAHGYGEGPVGAAVELDMDSEDADALTRNALQLLRAALSGLDDD